MRARCVARRGALTRIGSRSRNTKKDNMTQHHKREPSPLNEVIEWLTNATPDACNKERYNFFSGLEVDVEKLWREYLSECWSSYLRRGTTLPLFSHALSVTGAYLAGSMTMQKSPFTKDT